MTTQFKQKDSMHIKKAADHIRTASALLITAGAGLGVDSGLPDFRGNHGFWNAYPALHGYPFEAMANPTWFESHPQRAWGFYGHRLNLYRTTQPHIGFKILKSWSEKIPSFIFTSNVDGQFQKAGFDESQICECHGSIHWLQQIDPDRYGRDLISANPYQVDVDESLVLAQGELPQSRGGLLRPNILMFGDFSWLSNRTQAQENLLDTWINEVDRSRLVVIEVGAGTHVPSVRSFSNRMARYGATLIRINPRESHNAKIPIALKAAEALQAIADLV